MSKTKEPVGPPKRIETMSDIQKIKWLVVPDTLGIIDTVGMNIDFRSTPDELRPHVLAALLTEGYEHARRRSLLNKKVLGQNRFAITMVGIDNQLYSAYKNLTRSPNNENLDRLASYFGTVIYDIMDVPQRVPRDRKLARIAELWPLFSDRFRAELLERSENYFLNKDGNGGDDDAEGE